VIVILISCRDVLRYAQGDAIRRRKEALHEILFTVPSVPVPGSQVEVYYNPELTPLRGRPDIFVKGSYNRWRGRNGVYQRQAAAYCAKVRILSRFSLPVSPCNELSLWGEEEERGETI